MSSRQKFTPSVDGTPRTTVRASYRIDAGEWQEIEDMARDADTTPAKMLDALFAHAVRHELCEWREALNGDVPEAGRYEPQ